MIKSYGDELKSITGVEIPKNQRDSLFNALRDKDYSSTLSKTDNKIHRSEFNSKKNNLISQWETNTNRDWPKYEIDVMKKDGTCCFRKAGDKWDAHHIIENNRGGPNEWWNLHPAKSPDLHQGGIHRSGSALRVLDKYLKSGE